MVEIFATRRREAHRGAALACLRYCGIKRPDYRRANLHPFLVREFFKYRFKPRVRLANTFGILNNSFAIREKTAGKMGLEDALRGLNTGVDRFTVQV